MRAANMKDDLAEFNLDEGVDGTMTANNAADRLAESPDIGAKEDTI